MYLNFATPETTAYLPEKFPNFSTSALKILSTANILTGMLHTFHQIRFAFPKK